MSLWNKSIHTYHTCTAAVQEYVSCTSSRIYSDVPGTVCATYDREWDMKRETKREAPGGAAFVIQVWRKTTNAIFFFFSTLLRTYNSVVLYTILTELSVY